MSKIFVAIIGLFFVLQIQAQAQETPTASYNVIKNYTKENGLPVNAVTDLAIGKEGFLWIATHDGLLRFDGFNFKVHNTDTNLTMPSDRVRMIQSIPSGGLVVVLESDQLYFFNEGIFTKIGLSNLVSFKVANNQIWYGNKKGLYKWDVESHQNVAISKNVEVLSLTTNDKGVFIADNHCSVYFYSFNLNLLELLQKLDCGTAFQISVSELGELAVGSVNGVYILRKRVEHFLARETIRNLKWAKKRLFLISDYDIKILENDGKITNSPTGRTTNFTSGPIPSANVLDSGQLWINNYLKLETENELVFNSPSAIYQHVMDKNGGLWVATSLNGLFYLRKPMLKTEGEAITGNVVDIYLDSDGKLIVGSGRGLFSFDPQTKHWEKLKGINRGFRFLKDSASKFWVAHNTGLCVLNASSICEKQTYPISRFTEVFMLFEDQSNQIWVGSEKGLFMQAKGKWRDFKEVEGQFVFGIDIPQYGTFLASKDNGISIFQNNKRVDKINIDTGMTTNRTRTIYYDPRIDSDSILIGTENKGLCLWHLKKGLVRCASIDEGLPHYEVHRILPDEKNRLWLSSNRGIYAIDIEDLKKFYNFQIDYLPNHRFGENDGMADSEANGGSQSAGTVGKNGQLWFPTQRGIVRVPTNEIKTDHTILRPYIDEVLVDGVIQENTRNVVLDNPQKRNISIFLSTIALGMSDDIRFRYRFMPSQQWIELGTSRNINFNSLSVGKHEMEFQAALYSGWVGPTSLLSINVVPTLIETQWFRLLVMITILFGFMFWINNLRTRKYKLEKQVVKRTTQLSSALKLISEQKENIQTEAKRKQQHFLDLSHELRTPLTLVLGPLHTDKPIQGKTKSTMKRNVDRLLNLINQMLKLEQLDLFEQELNFASVAIVSRCKLGLDQFKHKTSKHQLKFDCHFPDHEVYVHGSTEEIDSMLTNLISNAIKFTPKSGTLRLTVKTTQSARCLIIIEDSGMGIPKKDRKHVFERFVRLNLENKEGSGLGLNIVQKIVKRHQGSVLVDESSLGGAKFEVSLPIESMQNNRNPAVIGQKSSKYTVLAVDDNADILALIQSILTPQYKVIICQSPRDGLEIAKRKIPDIIIVDIGMPHIDGYDFVRLIRKDFITKNIPVVFATARSHPEDQVNALKAGGDAFLTKPFMPEQLIAYVNRLLASRKNQTTHLDAHLELETELLEKAILITNQEMSDPDFDVEKLARKLAMSRSVLYRKFKQETDISPSEFIKKCRLENASELLQTTTLSISRISQLTGYKQVSTFTRSFNHFYGHNPKDHRKIKF